MSRFVRVGGVPEDRLETQWEYLYRCSNWTECYNGSLEINIDFCKFDSVKAVFNGICLKCCAPKWIIPGYNCTKYNQVTCCVYCFCDYCRCIRCFPVPDTVVCCRTYIDLAPCHNEFTFSTMTNCTKQFATVLDHEIVFTPLGCRDIGFNAMNIPNPACITPGSNLPHSGVYSTPQCCYIQTGGWENSKTLILCNICGIFPHDPNGGGNWAIYGQYKKFEV